MVFASAEYEHELVVFGSDPQTGLRAIIAVHDTTLGPALGGCRFWPYPSEEEALVDVLRLSKGMTYKAALANMKLGGGKSVIIGDPKKHKTHDLMRSMGTFINRLGGIYITAEDVGTTTEDMGRIKETTPHVVGLPIGDGGGGDPSIFTATGVVKGMQAAAAHKFGNPSLADKKIIVQGLGHVGRHVCDLVHALGARLAVFDIQPQLTREIAQKYGADILSEDEVFTTQADILAPCALGGGLSEATIPDLKVKIVAGAANNQLQTPQDGRLLKDYGILYAPDYVINAGGLINVGSEGPNYSKEAIMDHINIIPETLTKIFEMGDEENIPTSQAADKLAQLRIEASRGG